MSGAGKILAWEAGLAALMLVWFGLVAVLLASSRMHRVPTREGLLAARAAQAALAERVAAFFGGAK